MFCHSTPRSETEVFTRLTDEGKLIPLFEELNVSVVVCGHTHIQFYRMIGKTRVVNAGSVGEPYGEPGAHWLLLEPDVQLMHTTYDLTKAVERIRKTSFPGTQDYVRDITTPPAEAAMLELFSTAELK